MPQLTYQYHSQEVVNYFYGSQSVTANLPLYETGSTKNWQISLLGLRTINDKWSFVGNIQNEYFGDEITNSPLVDDDQRLSVFAGFLYRIF